MESLKSDSTVATLAPLRPRRSLEPLSVLVVNMIWLNEIGRASCMFWEARQPLSTEGYPLLRAGDGGGSGSACVGAPGDGALLEASRGAFPPSLHPSFSSSFPLLHASVLPAAVCLRWVRLQSAAVREEEEKERVSERKGEGRWRAELRFIKSCFICWAMCLSLIIEAHSDLAQNPSRVAQFTFPLFWGEMRNRTW